MNNPSRPRFRIGVLAFGFSCLLLGGASANAAESKDAPEVARKQGPQEFRFDFGLFGGAHFFNRGNPLGHRPADTDPEDPDYLDNFQRDGVSPKTGGMFGGRLGFHFNRWIGLEAEVSAIPTKTRTTDNQPASTSVWTFGYRGSLIVNLTDSYEFQPFILAGYGGMTTLADKVEIIRNDTWGFLHAGLGFKVGFTPWTGLRVDGRIMAPWTSLAPVVPQGNRVDYDGPDWEALGSLYINFGEVEKAVILQPTSKDRDGDGVLDAADRCPDQPEDRDGFQDEDGCPDLDNDADGIPDGLDKCPNEAEDKDGFEDTDGCPDTDNDGDSVTDARDKCPNEPEDKDGFQDEDGCPDLDNDADGMPDTRDKCPNEPETINNYKDEDGCPDEIPAAVKKFTGVIEGINFKTGSADILAGSYVILDRAIKVLLEFPDVNLEISGHTDNRGKADYNRDLSQRRADSVKTYFVQRGISSSRLQSIGYGPTRPIADNRSQSGRATNRRTEFRLITVGGK
jgi:outer membrane protein OmpA-like peptidoglycan-associated protein